MTHPHPRAAAVRTREDVLREFDMYPDGKLVDAMADRIAALEARAETRVADDMVERAIRVGRDYGYFDWDESGEERFAGMRAVLTAALTGGASDA